MGAMFQAWDNRLAANETIQLSCLSLGSVRILHLPGETFVGFQLWAQRLEPNAFVAMAAYGDTGMWYNGTDQIYTDSGGYEQSWSFVNASEDLMKSAISELLVAGQCASDFTCSVDEGQGEVTLNWTAASGIDATDYEIFRDGGSLGTVPLGQSSYVDDPSVTPGSFATVEYELVTVKSGQEHPCAPRQCVAVFGGSAPATLVLNRSEYILGEPVVLTYVNGPGNARDRVAIVRRGDTPSDDSLSGNPWLWSTGLYRPAPAADPGPEDNTVTMRETNGTGVPYGYWDAYLLTNGTYTVAAGPVAFAVRPEGINRADFNGDGEVNLQDSGILATAWMAVQGSPQWEVACDISRPVDNIIDLQDLAAFTTEWLALPLESSD